MTNDDRQATLNSLCQGYQDFRAAAEQAWEKGDEDDALGLEMMASQYAASAKDLMTDTEGAR